MGLAERLQYNVQPELGWNYGLGQRRVRDREVAVQNWVGIDARVPAVYPLGVLEHCILTGSGVHSRTGREAKTEIPAKKEENQT